MTNLFNVAKESHTIPTLTVPTDAPATEPSPDEESSGVAVTMAPADHARSDTRPAAATSAPLPDDATAPDADPDTAPDPRIRIYHGRYVDYHDQRLETWDALIGANSRGEAAPVFYRRDGMMVTVHDADDGLPLIQRVSQHLMENYLADIISWRTLTRDGTEKPVPPPPRLARSMPTTPDSRLPVLAGVTLVPFQPALFSRRKTDRQFAPRLARSITPDSRLPSTRRCHQPALFSRRPIGSSRPRWLSRP